MSNIECLTRIRARLGPLRLRRRRVGTVHGRRHLCTAAAATTSGQRGRGLKRMRLTLVPVLVVHIVLVARAVRMVLAGHVEQSSTASAAVRSMCASSLTRRSSCIASGTPTIRTFSLLRLTTVVVAVPVGQRRLHVHPAIRLRRRHWGSWRRLCLVHKRVHGRLREGDPRRLISWTREEN